MMPVSDAELVQAFRGGDRGAFAILIERHRDRAVAVAHAVAGNYLLAEDAAQEATYQAFFEIERLKQPERFAAWLCSIAVNLTKMALRRRRVITSWDDLYGGRYAEGVPARDSDDPQLALQTMELQSRVRRALEVLSVEMRAAVWLHYVEGMTYQEVSHVTGIPAGRLRVLSHRARERLRRELADEWRPRGERGQKMVEVKLHDIRVMTRPERPGDLPFLSWVVFLKAVNDDRGMAIWVGPHEGESIAMRMADMAPPRPQTYALTGPAH